MLAATFTLPKRARGRQSEAAQAAYDARCADFAAHMRQIASSLDFTPGVRGWCYLLESFGLITKGEFDTAQRLITDLRKSGLLPLDICAEDGAREWQLVENVDGRNVDRHGRRLLNSLDGWIERYLPFSFWDDKPVYIQMMVEKIDLRELFAPVCGRFRVPLANAKGWSDLHTRAAMMRRFAEHEAAGRQCVLLYCGDFDPAGLRISDYLRSNMAELSGAIGGWLPDSVIIDRFGLNYDFITDNALSWIDNLETGSGRDLADPKHPEHSKDYVQDYLRQYGRRKVEANALVVRADAARKLCLDAILRYLPDEGAPAAFDATLSPWREGLRQAVRDMIDDAV